MILFSWEGTECFNGWLSTMQTNNKLNYRLPKSQMSKENYNKFIALWSLPVKKLSTVLVWPHPMIRTSPWLDMVHNLSTILRHLNIRLELFWACSNTSMSLFVSSKPYSCFLIMYLFAKTNALYVIDCVKRNQMCDPCMGELWKQNITCGIGILIHIWFCFMVLFDRCLQPPIYNKSMVWLRSWQMTDSLCHSDGSQTRQKIPGLTFVMQ
jgi:hypothetical protein